MNGEIWRPVPGWVSYEASNKGRVRSVRSGRVLSSPPGGDGYRRVYFKVEGRRSAWTVHRVVLAAFRGPRPEGAQIRHLDGDKSNNHLENLAYGTPSENAADTKRHGQNSNLNKTHCPNGHEYAGWNLIDRDSHGRGCRSCAYAASEAWRMAKFGHHLDKRSFADDLYRRNQP
ncbi:HNH endonuclease [Saccharopolyspora erythraea]|uniref:NUMOD4 motif-containing HNH endonuclease n=1 Tax=Saccharopolyspora erythraea TaxID=1836 RepID=UPI001BA75BE0|nr:NUMOD4 motif-containing HNH endonuclease [Saccharopolyspora erythraea]QUH01416.1 HNH endonuclease [Saccharopolyspora erythraea]